MGEDAIAELRQKWDAYDARLNNPDAHTGGSLAGAAYLIARSGITDVALLLDRLAAAERVVEAAREYLTVLTEADSFECFDPDLPDVDDDVLAERPCGECAACRFAAALASAPSTDRGADG